MAYLDEPNVISGKRGRMKYVFIGLGILLFLLLVFSAVLEPWFRDFQRHRTPSGPHGGDLYSITVENRRMAMEIARPEPDNHLVIFLSPAEEDPDWNPADYRLSFEIRGMPEPRFLDWNEEGMILASGEELLEYDPLDPRPPPFPRIREFYGPSEASFHPSGEFRMTIRIHRGDEVVWEGERWSYADPHAGHGHGHGHAH